MAEEGLVNQGNKELQAESFRELGRAFGGNLKKKRRGNRGGPGELQRNKRRANSSRYKQFGGSLGVPKKK